MPKKKPASAKTTKASFLKSQPASSSAKEILARGKETGIALTSKYISTVRPDATKTPRKPGRPLGSKNKVSIVKVQPSSAKVEDLLRAAASEIGLSRAISILSDQRNALRAVLGS